MDFGRRQNIPFVTAGLILANIIVFLVMEITGSTENTLFMLDHGASFAPYVIYRKEYYRLFTSMFMHFGIAHITNNMLILAVLGSRLEYAMGRIKYLFFYLLSGVGAGMISVAYDEYCSSYAVSAGASGAVFGVIGGLIYAVIINRGHLGDLSQRQLLILAALSLYHGFVGSGIDNAAHVGGLLCGLILAVFFYRRPKSKYPPNYWGEKL